MVVRGLDCTDLWGWVRLSVETSAWALLNNDISDIQSLTAPGFDMRDTRRYADPILPLPTSNLVSDTLLEIDLIAPQEK